MSSDEAESLSEPHNYKRKKIWRASFTAAVCFLFVAVAALVFNNFFIYRSYDSMKKKYQDTFLRVETVSAVKNELITQNENIKKDYLFLKEEYNKLINQNKEILKRLEELKKDNQELIEDNIELQNSLKKAASVGIKPQNYTRFDGITSRSSIERGEYIGSFHGTAYTPSKIECGNDMGITNSGKPIIPGVSIAVDKKYWPFGTVFYIKGLGYAIAMDTGNAIKGKYRFDFAVFDRNFAKKLGTDYWDVYLVKLGNGKVDDIPL